MSDNPAKDLADAVRDDHRSCVAKRAYAKAVAPSVATSCRACSALAAYDAWKPWEDEAVVERAAKALLRREYRRDVSDAEVDAMWGELGIIAGRYSEERREDYRESARAALKSALGGGDE